MGQELSSDKLEEREEELKENLKSLREVASSHKYRYNNMKKRYDLGVRASTMYEQWTGLKEKKKELLVDIDNTDVLITKTKIDDNEYQNALNLLLDEKLKIQEIENLKEIEESSLLEQAERKLQNSTFLEVKLRREVEDVSTFTPVLTLYTSTCTCTMYLHLYFHYVLTPVLTPVLQ